MFLAELKISNFRKIASATIHFQPGLNILVGANNVGKTAVVDALRALLAGHDEPYPRLDTQDIHHPKGGAATGDINLHYTFRDLSPDDEADFLAALQPDRNGKFEVRISIRYGTPDKAGRLRAKRWCGDHEDHALTSEMMENLRGVYLQPLRDASHSLKPSRTSQLARLIHLLTDDAGRAEIDKALEKLDAHLKKENPIVITQSAITTRHDDMLGAELKQLLEVGLSSSDFQKLSSRLSLTVDSFEIEQNGLGFNNLIFMAVVLSELSKNPDAAYSSLIIEEPEAHLHPQLQAILLQYLEGIQAKKKPEDKPVQLFLTSHSPNFASIANLSSLTCLFDTGTGIATFFPRDVTFGKGKREKLERYLDITRAELFFARRIIFVEGAAELMMVSVLADKIGKNLRQHGVSLISVEGLNFDSFLPLFGKDALTIPVAVITDADPGKEDDGTGKTLPVYPCPGDTITLSDNTTKMKELEDDYVKVFCGLKTFEYDLALTSKNRQAMLAALKDIHPKMATKVETAVTTAITDAEKAKALFTGMFERDSNNVQKGKFGQALAAILTDKENPVDFDVPDYMKLAIEHACKKMP
jgi:putative ATP-dependent endonuclease of OLD family